MRGEALTFLGAHEDQVADPLIEAESPMNLAFTTTHENSYFQRRSLYIWCEMG